MFVGVVAEAEAGHVGVVGGAEYGEAVDPVEHPPAQSHCLQQQYTRVAGGGQFRGGLGQGVLFAEGEGERFFDVDQSAELVQAG
ncbi:hypothetical protein [Saccharomonospora viridis]|uniref:hypothetical protein n=1 Tax=Saccharomonospora viridis TaxID=1852 RepID=UPI003C6DC23B